MQLPKMENGLARLRLLAPEDSSRIGMGFDRQSRRLGKGFLLPLLWLVLLAPPAAAETFPLFPCGPSTQRDQFRLFHGSSCAGPILVIRTFEAVGFETASALRAPEDLSARADESGPTSARGEGPANRESWWFSSARMFDGRVLLVTSAFLGYVGIHGNELWWEDSRRVDFHAGNEGGLAFGTDSYTGGADKASHFVGSYTASQALAKVYGLLGKPANKSRLLGASMAWLAGLAIEVGDGYSYFGYSWGDMLANTLGAAAAMELSRLGWDDTIGFRLGTVKYDKPPRVQSGPGLGSGYTGEVYSADVKLAGALPRFGLDPGIARYLLVSLTYGTKGYRFQPPELRERNVGIDVGLNLPEILRTLGMQDDSWWGRPILEYLTYRRIEFTVFGFRYDLNHRRWNGPDTGKGYDPRP